MNVWEGAPRPTSLESAGPHGMNVGVQAVGILESSKHFQQEFLIFLRERAGQSRGPCFSGAGQREKEKVNNLQIYFGD